MAVLYRIPKNVRQAFQIFKIYSDGIFQLENQNGKQKDLYDRTYLFADINYINQNEEEKRGILSAFMQFLNAMSVDFKISAVSQFQGTESQIYDQGSGEKQESFLGLAEGIRNWKEELTERGSGEGVKRCLYLTVTVRAMNYGDAKTFFASMESQIARLFQAFGSRIYPLNSAERISILRDFLRGEAGTLEREKGEATLADILPISLEMEKDHLILGSRYVSVLTAREYAASLSEDRVFRALSSLPYPSICTLDYAPVGQAVLKDMLTAVHINQERAIAQEIDARRKRGMYALGTSYVKEKQKEELEAYQDQIEDNSESGFLTGLLVAVEADSLELLHERLESVRSIGRENGILLETYNWVQAKALNTALPVGCRMVDNMRAFLTSSLVALQPFFAQDLQEPKGILYGLNRTTKHLVFGNRKRLTSPHGIIIGHTGSGKSFHLKATEISQVLLSTEDDLICIDPQNELQEVCEEFGGQFLEIASGGEIRINPMEIPGYVYRTKSEAVRNQFVAEQCAWASAYCEAVMKNIVYTQEYRALVSRCVRKLYARAFVQSAKKQPTLVALRTEIGNLMEQAEEPEEAAILRRIYNSLEEHTLGNADLFSHPSNVNFQKRLIVFGLKKVDPELWGTVMITVMHFLTNRLTYNQTEQRTTRLIVDETQVVCAQKSSADILLRAVTTYRKFGGICTLVFQNLSRVLENPELRDMLSNCGYKCIFDQGGVDATALREIHNLSETEYESLAQQTPGYCLMVWGQKVILLDTRMDRENPIYSTFSTNFHEQQELRKIQAEDPKKELCRAVCRMAEVIPIKKQEIQEILKLSGQETETLLRKLCMEGRLEAVSFAGSIQYRASRESGER